MRGWQNKTIYIRLVPDIVQTACRSDRNDRLWPHFQEYTRLIVYFFFCVITCKHYRVYLPSLLFKVSTIFSSKITFDVARSAMGNVSGRKKAEDKRKEKRKKKRRKALIHSHRCVTPLLPQQKFTTELMTKGRAPMQPIVAWRTMWRLWKANPSAPLTAWAFKQTRGAISPQGWLASDSGGKPRAAHHHWAFALSADWDAIVRGEYYLHCRAVVLFVVSEDEPGWCPTEGRPRR